MPMQAGDVALADIPFTDGSSSKIRPVLVLWVESQDAVVSAITSAPSRGVADVELNDWKAAGLRVPSTVRLSRLDCLEGMLLIRRLGKITDADASRLRAVWDSHVKPQF